MPIRRLLSPALVLIFLAVACAGSETSETSTVLQTSAPLATPTTEPPAPATEAAETSEAMAEGAATTGAAEVPAVNPTGELAHVVLVPPGDELNIRFGPGIGFDIAGAFGPTARDLPLTDVTDVVNGSPWVFIDQNGWVAEFYLTKAVDTATAESNPATMDVVDRLSMIMESGGDLTEVAGWRGLFLAHFDPVRRFEVEALAGLLSDPALLEWGSLGCSPEECEDMTFSEAVAESFLDAWRDDDRIVAFDETIPGPGGLIEEAIIPQEFVNYHYVAVHDPGDEPQFDGLDWVTWYVYLDYSDNDPVVVGMSIDSWGP